jgi:hypothetical protein
MRDRDLFNSTFHGLVEHGVRIVEIPDPTIVPESDVEDVPDDEALAAG